MEKEFLVRPAISLAFKGVKWMIQRLLSKKFPVDLDKMHVVSERVFLHDDETLPNLFFVFDLVNRTNDDISVIGFSVTVVSGSKVILKDFCMVTQYLKLDSELTSISYSGVLSKSQSDVLRKMKAESRSIDMLLDFHLGVRGKFENHQKRLSLLVG